MTAVEDDAERATGAREVTFGFRFGCALSQKTAVVRKPLQSGIE
jgi:hypothetical protein